MLVIVLVALGMLRIGGQVKEYRGLNAELSVHQEELARVTAEYDACQEQLSLLSDDAYIERVAREKLGMVSPGETVVMPMDTDAYAEQ